MVKRLLLSLLVLVSLFSAGMAVLVPQSAAAATAAHCVRQDPSLLDFPTWYKYLDPQFVEGECRLTFDIRTDIPNVVLAVFEIVLRIAGIVSVIFVIYGGFLYLTSTGEPDKARNGRTTILNALVGLTISVLSVAIVNLIARNIA